MAGGIETTPAAAPGSETRSADGRRTVGLYLPYTSGGRVISEVSLAPCTFGHLLRWQDGRIGGGLALLTELSGLTFAQIEGLRQPDDARVMDALLAHVHPDIAEDIRTGRVPLMTPGPYAAGMASEGAPAAESGAEAPAAVFDSPHPFGGETDLPDWAGVESVTERPADYVPGVDD